MKELKTLMHFAKPYKWWILLATICMILVTGMTMAGPWAIRSLVEIGEKGNGTIQEINRIGFIILGIYIIRAVSRFGTNYISHYAAWKILEDVRSHLYNHLQSLSVKFFKDKQTGDLMSRVINDTRNFEVLLAHAIPTLIVNVVMFIGISIILFSMNATLALYTLIPIPILVFMVLKFNKISRPRFRVAQKHIAEVNSILHDNFAGIKEIKSFTKENHESGRVRKIIAAHTKSILDALRLSNGFHPSIEFVSSIGTVIVIFVGGALVIDNNLSLADLVAFLLYMATFYQPIQALGQINEGIQQALASADRVVEILDETTEIKEKPNAIQLEAINHAIEFNKVGFHYIDQIQVLNNISFKIPAGETLALVGATGVGKTTIASLIPRFYDPTSGEILIDGIDLHDYSLASVRSQISLVSQDVFLFNGTIKDNILYGRQDATDEEVIEAAKAANAHDFILKLELGYDTIVGERGVKLSGGQKQRISIARAILKDAPILILDEATSAVDTETERLIQEALNQLKQNKTSIVIAHRLSTVKEANQIVVLKEGEIIEQGTHDQLIDQDGLYRKLCMAQSTDIQNDTLQLN